MEVRTQKQLDAALKKGERYIDLVGDGEFTVRAYGSSQVTACGSSQVTAYDSSQVTAYGSSQVRACDSSQVRATKYVAVTKHGDRPKVKGGVLISIRRAETAEEWCEFYGVPVKRGIAVLFKAVEDDWKGSTKHADISYEPGSKPVAHDWNEAAVCGGGLHLVPRPFMGDQYVSGRVAHYVGCPVRVAEMVLLEDKVKVPRLAKPTFEVDIDGEPV